MNPLQKHAIQQSMKLAATLRQQRESLKTISTTELVDLVRDSNGSKAPSTTEGRIMGGTPTLHFASQNDVALLVGGGNDPLAEFEEAHALCVANGKTTHHFVCNDMLSCFPGVIHHGCTLHPDKWSYWKTVRERGGHPPVQALWSHRSYPSFDFHTKDWQGSSGLFMGKVARELGFTHIIGCGIPMTIEGEHFARGQRWNAAPGFLRGWARVQGSLKPFFRSMSGWTKEHFGAPDAEWLNSSIPDPYPLTAKFDHTGVKA